MNLKPDERSVSHELSKPSAADPKNNHNDPHETTPGLTEPDPNLINC